MCGPDNFFTSRNCLVYSIGSNGDFSFEADIRNRLNCEIHTFDPTGDTVLYEETAKPFQVQYHNWGLSGTRGSIWNHVLNVENPLLPLPDIMRRLNHTHRHIDILKIDCEGCEYSAFPVIWDSISSGRLTIGQILIELHTTDRNQIATFFDMANSAGFYIFHKERNHWGCDGYNCVEYALISNNTAWDIFSSALCL